MTSSINNSVVNHSCREKWLKPNIKRNSDSSVFTLKKYLKLLPLKYKNEFKISKNVSIPGNNKLPIKLN